MHVVVAALPYDLSESPFDGFVIRHLDIVEALAARYPVTLLLIRRPGENHHVSARLANLPRAEVEATWRVTARRSRIAHAVRSSLNVDSSPVTAAFHRVVEQIGADVAVTIGPWLNHEFRPVFKRLPSLHLLEEDLSRMSEIAPQSPQARVFRSVERGLHRRNRDQPVLVGVIADPELRLGKRLYPKSRVLVVPYSLPTADWPLADQRSIGQRVIVTGVLVQERNAEGLAAVLSEIQRADLFHKIRFDLVTNAGIHESVRAFIDGHNVRHVTPESSLYQHYRSARVALIPATRVTGLKTTVLQAWAAGCPVVCYPQSRATLGPGAGSAVLVGRDAGEVVERLIAVIDDDDTAESLVASGRVLMETRFRPGAQIDAVSGLLVELATHGRQAADH